MSCGCKQPNETHGDERNITLRDLEQAAAAGGTNVQGVMKNFKQDFDLAVPVSSTAGRAGRQGNGDR
ncbi:MAG TPA: hypothetical protein VLS25_02470 [Dehalococcoidia bacterium]|nr:hypothetical protein [Dehalococcoidia bacterium]